MHIRRGSPRSPVRPARATSPFGSTSTGPARREIESPLGFMNHMLSQIARHGMFDLTVKADGDIETGSHHTAEDTAIVLGRTIDKALGERRGIVRMASALVPLDEALAQVALDLSGRGYAVVDMGSNNNQGEFPTDLARHFFEAMAIEGRFNLNLRVISGLNEHHVIEASSRRSLGRCGQLAPWTRGPQGGVPSTKGRCRAKKLSQKGASTSSARTGPLARHERSP